MLTKIWTATIVLSAVASIVAWVCVAAHARGIRPLRAIARFTQKLSLAGVVVFGLMAAPLYRAGSTKVGGGTNNVPPNLNHPLPQMQQGDILSQTGFTGLPFPVPHSPFPIANPVQDPITSTNTTRTLEAADFERGFVMTRIGTDEEFDSTPPPNATIVSDWRSFGAATDWVYVALTNWMFTVGTNEVERLRVYSFGKVAPLVRDAAGTIATDNWFAPFMASLGIVPEANWQLLGNGEPGTGNGLESQVWYCITPDNSLVVTWQNALLDRDTGKPVSFQVEFFTDGRFVFRYDLSRLGGGEAANVLAGASFCGNEWATNSLPTNVTSMAFYPLSEDDAYDQDPDGDGLLTIDELFFYNTDPHNADTDYDGLNDGEELFVYNSNPLDPNSISAAYCDGFAVKLGDLDPFSCPEGSTNTVLEHIFYSGTTNGVFAYPTSTVETAVLKIMVSGEGTGRLVVGDTVVPLVAPPPMRSGAQTNTLLLAVGKGVRKSLWWDKPDGLDVALRSDDLLIGRMPTWYLPHGWLAFPHTDATTPCIHDFVSNGKTVSLVHGEEFPGLTATWTNGNADVEIENLPPDSAEIHGHFARNQTRPISYTVDHPSRLNEEPVAFAQTLRFCPNLADEDAPPGVEDEDYDSSEWPMQSGMPEVEDTTSEYEAAAEYARIAGLPLAQGVLQLYGPIDREDMVSLTVPTGAPVRCCDCPDHWQSNYVAAAWTSPRLSVYDVADNHFDISYEDVMVSVRGEYPSREPYGDGVLFVTNGAPSFTKAYTVLGVDIENLYGPTLSEYASLNASFGFPITVTTNLDNATELEFQSDVLLSNGVFKVAIDDATAPFEIWIGGCWTWDDDLCENVYHPPFLLVDGARADGRHFTVRQWRKLAEDRGYGRYLPFYILSSSTGRCDLVFSYVFDQNGSAIRSAVRRRITSVNPPLLVDYDRDGRIDSSDALAWIDGRLAYFWKNDDKFKGDDAFSSSSALNSGNGVVDGRNDLVNFLTIGVDVSAFASRWSALDVDYRIVAYSSGLRNAKLALADIQWSQIGDAAFGEDFDIHGNALHEAPIATLGTGTNLPPSFVALSHTGRSTLFVEFPDEQRNDSLYLRIYSKSDGSCLYSQAMRLHVGNVSGMIGWLNLRGAAGGSDGVPTRLSTPDWPADAHGPGNVVFVHGYNMAEDAETPDWAKNMFKKLWWSGLDRGFVAVQWRGNEGQYYQVGYGWVSPNYYGNVQNAFATASALKTAMDDVQSPKWFIAHSLGNMLVSAAIQDYEMPYERYFMLNAAVAMEAYDPTFGISQESHDNMTPVAWTNYVDMVRATHWFELFPEGDGRRLLTWKGRFSNVTNIVNFYSTQEDVVCNGDGTQMPYGRPYSWYNQEYRKGSWAMMLHEYEGGWEFNPYHDTVTGSWGGNEYVEHRQRMSPQDAANLTGETLRQHPFFLDFANPEMYTSSNGLIVASNYLYRAEMLAYAIPSESYAVGANPLPGLNAYTNAITGAVVPSRNHNMAAEYTFGQDDLPQNGSEFEDKHRDWQHSTFVQRSYKRVHQLFKAITQTIKEESNE